MQPSKKISLLPQTTAPTSSDKVPLVSGGTTDYSLMSDLIALFFNNIPTGAHSDVTRASETFFDFVKPTTGVWTADSVGVNRNASMSAATVYINGRRIPITAVTARTFTASKDTYIDILDNQDGTGTIVYTEATNNAASPALAANSIRIGIIVTGATTIATTGSINQGQETIVLPIASSVPYTTTDSLGNLICPRDPNRKLLGYRRVTTAQTGVSTTVVQVTGLACPVVIPLGRKIKVSAKFPSLVPAVAFGAHFPSLWEGAVVTGVELTEDNLQSNGTGTTSTPTYIEEIRTPASASLTYNAGMKNNGSGGSTTSIQSSSTAASWIKVELE